MRGFHSKKSTGRFASRFISIQKIQEWVRAQFLRLTSRRYIRIKRRTRILIALATVSTLTVIGIFSYVTNPFVKFSVVTDPHSTIFTTETGEISFEYEEGIILRDDPFFNHLAKVKSTWHILTSRFHRPKLAESQTVDEIIREIHQLRFDPELPFIISGDHFSVLYPRSLGIFYHTLLDSRTALDDEDWLNRQVIYAKTLGYALEVFSQSENLSTTIVPIGPRSVALFNVYAPPSDTLYSLLFGIERLQNQDYFQEVYPIDSLSLDPQTATPASILNNQISSVRPLVTDELADEFLNRHRDSLQRHFHTYFEMVYDPVTGLVKKDIKLSSTKDIVWRESAFYDNVILWKTYQLAGELGIIEPDPAFLSAYKNRILAAFWLDREGLFLEDLSDEARTERWYSGDWLIAFQTGFLNPSNPTDLPYLEKSVAYIRRNAIDQPFAMQFNPDRRPERLYRVVRLSAPDYGSTTIWSNWGMEYAKLLVRLGQETGVEAYISAAERQFEAYTFNIRRYRGYPEVYNYQGEVYRTPLYRSIIRTGWVVTYEQFRAMIDEYTSQPE